MIVLLSQDMIMGALLPKISNADIASLCCRHALEVMKQHDKVRVAGKTNQFEVRVVRHEAIGVDVERAGAAFGPQKIKQYLHQFAPRKQKLTRLCARRNEIPIMPHVAGARQAVRLTNKIGRCHREIVAP